MSTLSVLLADDHAVVRAGIRKVVEELSDVQVIAEVGDGIELFAALEHFRPDCLLIDVTMPDFEPIAAIRRIRQQYPQLYENQALPTSGSGNCCTQESHEG